MKFNRGDVVYLKPELLNESWYHDQKMVFVSYITYPKYCVRVKFLKNGKMLYTYYNMNFIEVDIVETRKKKIEKIIM